MLDGSSCARDNRCSSNDCTHARLLLILLVGLLVGGISENGTCEGRKGIVPVLAGNEGVGDEMHNRPNTPASLQ